MELSKVREIQGLISRIFVFLLLFLKMYNNTKLFSPATIENRNGDVHPNQVMDLFYEENITIIAANDSKYETDLGSTTVETEPTGDSVLGQEKP